MSRNTAAKRRAISGKNRTAIKPRCAFMASQTTFGHLIAWFEAIVLSPTFHVDNDGDACIITGLGAFKVWENIETATDAADIYNLRQLGAPLCFGALTTVKVGLKHQQPLSINTYKAAHAELCRITAAIGRLNNRTQIGLGETTKGRAWAELAQAAV